MAMKSGLEVLTVGAKENRTSEVDSKLPEGEQREAPSEPETKGLEEEKPNWENTYSEAEIKVRTALPTSLPLAIRIEKLHHRRIIS